MFPLKKREVSGYTFGKPTWYSKFHLGTDYRADHDTVYAPFDGTILKTVKAAQGGNTIWFKPDNQDVVIRFMHLYSFLAKGHVTEETPIAISDNTGASTSPHLHIDISKHDVQLNNTSNFIDPQTFNWNSMTFPIQMPFTAVANNLNVPSLINSLSAVAEMMKTYSRNRINLPFDIKNTSFSSVPFADLAGVVGPETNWYRQNITPLCTGKVSLLLMNDQEWLGNTTGAMTWGDTGKPGRISLHVMEATFIEQAFHELCHALLFFTGQKDGYTLNGEQHFVVHDYLFQNPPDKYGLLDSLDYAKLQTALNNIKPMDKIKIRSIGWNDAEKGLYFPFDTMERRQALLDKLTSLFPDYELDATEYNLGKRPWK